MMALSRGNSAHSRIVASLKVALPLIALGILSTLFLVSRTIDPADAIPYAEVDVQDRIREPRMTTPTFAGVTSDGSSLTVLADEARPGNGDAVGTAVNVHATLALPTGSETTFTAGTASLDTKGKQIELGGGVDIATPQGFRIVTDSLTAALDKTNVTSGGPVTATGPLGNLWSESMAITQQGESGTYVLLFQKGVKLVYLPQGSQ
jgi:lipopolysaccharide export system protein LptC